MNILSILKMESGVNIRTQPRQYPAVPSIWVECKTYTVILSDIFYYPLRWRYLLSVDREDYKKWKLNWLDFYPAKSLLVKNICTGEPRPGKYIFQYFLLVSALRDKKDKPNLSKCSCKVSLPQITSFTSILMQIIKKEIWKT